MNSSVLFPDVCGATRACLSNGDTEIFPAARLVSYLLSRRCESARRDLRVFVLLSKFAIIPSFSSPVLFLIIVN